MEAEAVHRAIRLAELAEIPVYIVHLSSPEALEAVVEARDRGIPAFAETCPHYLFLDINEYEAPGFESAKYVMTPHCGNATVNIISGADCDSTICKLSQPITVHFALMSSL